jgi:hypothetical protein
MSGTATQSPWAGYLAGPLTDAEKADTRLFTGYPLYGSQAGGGYQINGMLELRMVNLSAVESQILRWYLASLYPLHQAVIDAGTNLGTDKAAAWTRNKDEVADRSNLYNRKRRDFCEFIGVNPGGGLLDTGTLIRT